MIMSTGRWLRNLNWKVLLSLVLARFMVVVVVYVRCLFVQETLLLIYRLYEMRMKKQD